MLATMPVRIRPRMLTFPVKGHFLSMYDPSMACKDIITCWACCVYLWRVHPFIWTKLSSQDMDEKQNPRFDLAHKKAHVWGIWTMSWRHETRKWACFNLCKFLIPPWNCGKNKPIITVFTRVLVDPVYKSTPNFWGQKLDFLHFQIRISWKIILYFVELSFSYHRYVNKSQQVSTPSFNKLIRMCIRAFYTV